MIKKKIKLTLAGVITLLGLGLTTPAMASGWAQAYADYYTGGNDKVLGLEGGKGNFYGFIEQNLDDNSTFAKGTYHTPIYKGFGTYVQAQYFGDAYFEEGQAYAGFGYTDLKGKGWSITPWVAYGMIENTFSDDHRGLAGFTANMFVGTNQMIYNWTEIGLDKLSVNGAVGIQQNLTPKLYVALQYRFMYDDAGVEGYGDEAMIRLGYKF